MKLDRQTLKFLFLLISGILAFNFILNNLHVIPDSIGFLFKLLIPFIIGSAIAFIVNVPMKKIETFLETQTKIKPSNRRLIALLFAILFVIGIVVFVLFLVVPAFIQASIDMVNSLPSIIENLTDTISHWFKDYPSVITQIEKVQADWTTMLSDFMENLGTTMSDIVPRLFGLLTTTISTLFNVVVGFVFAIYILLAKEGLKRQYRKILFAVLPADRANYILDFGTLTNHIFTQFLTGQVTEAFINGGLYFIGGLIFRFPYGIVIAVTMGFCALIPYFGAFIGSFIGFVLIASQSFPAAVFFLVFSLIIQQIDGNIIYPRVVGDQIGLPAIWVLVAVTLGASLYGLVGMVIMVPLFSVLYALVTMWINRTLEKRRVNVDQMESRKLGNLFPKRDGSHDDHTI